MRTFNRRYFWPATLLATTLLVVIPLLANASNVSEVRKLEGFTAVELASSSDVKINEGDNFEVKVTGPAELLAQAKTAVRAKTLAISFQRKGWFGNDDSEYLQFEITMPRIEGIYSIGAGDIAVGPLQTGELSVGIEGSGNIDMDSARAQSLQLLAAGSGDIDMDSAEVQALRLSAVGSGDIGINKARASLLQLSTAGSGDIGIRQLQATEAMATLSGSGNIEVSGKVKRQTINITGSGDFQGRELNAEIAGGSVSGSGNIEMGKVKQPSFQQTGNGKISLAD